MKKFFKNKYFFSFISLTCSGIAILIFYFLTFKGSDFTELLHKIFRVIAPILYGFVLAYILTPMLNYIENKIVIPILNKFSIKIDSVKKKKRLRAFSVFISIFVFILLLIMFFRLLVPQVIDSVEKFAELFPVYISNTELWLDGKLKDYPEAEKLFEKYFNDYSTELQNFLTGELIPQIQVLIKSITSNVLSTVVGFFRVLWNFLIGIIVSVYMLYSKELYSAQAKRLLYSFFSEKKANDILVESRFIHKTFTGFFAGKIIDSVIIGLLCFLGTSILSIPYAVLVSLVVGVTNIIPFVGPLIGAIPSALFIFVVDPKACLYFIIFILCLQQLDGNIIGPKIMGESIGLSTFWVIFAITVFGGMYGIIGILIGVPLFAIIYSAIRDISTKLLKEKGLPDFTSAYTYLETVDDGKIVLFNEEKSTEENEGVVITIKVDNENNEE